MLKEAFKLLGKIDGVDVLATEARYHESCRRTTSDVMVASIIKLVAVTLVLVQWQNEKQYSNEFDTVWEYDQKELLQSGTVVCMYMRHNMYQQRMEKLYLAFYNPESRPQPLQGD